MLSVSQGLTSLRSFVVEACPQCALRCFRMTSSAALSTISLVSSRCGFSSCICLANLQYLYPALCELTLNFIGSTKLAPAESVATREIRPEASCSWLFACLWKNACHISPDVLDETCHGLLKLVTRAL